MADQGFISIIIVETLVPIYRFENFVADGFLLSLIDSSRCEFHDLLLIAAIDHRFGELSCAT